MSNSLIDESAYTDAVGPYDFASALNQPGGHAWARSVVESYARAKDKRRDPDTHLANMVRRVRENLLDNKPVQAMDWLRDIETHLKGRGAI